MERNSGANKQTADAQTMEIGEAQLHLTSDGSRCTLHETLFCWFARLLVLVPDFQNGNMTLLFIVKTVRRSKIRLFFFAGRESCSPSPTRYIFQTHVIPHGYEKHCDSKRRKTLEIRSKSTIRWIKNKKKRRNISNPRLLHCRENYSRRSVISLERIEKVTYLLTVDSS